MADLYAHPTVRGLAAFVTATDQPTDQPTEELAEAPIGAAPRPVRHSTARVAVCGAAQLAALYGWLLLVGLPALVLLYRLLLVAGVPVPGLSAGGTLGRLAHLDVDRFVPLEIGWTLANAVLLPALGGRLLLAACDRAGTRSGAPCTCGSGCTPRCRR